MQAFTITRTQQSFLLKQARASIVYGLEHGVPLMPTASCDDELKERVGCFVTLLKDNQLRGCIGTLEPWRPLVEDVCANAFSAAFHDDRFPEVKTWELPQISIEISVLTPLQEILCDGEQDLLNQLKPHVDGLAIEAGSHRATFLPLVWQQLPEKKQFLSQLKRKANLDENYWSDTMRCYRYHTIVFHES